MRKKLDTRFPAARIKKIMQADEEVGKIAMAVPLLVSKALELFLQDLCDRSYEITLKRGAKTLNSLHLKQCVQTFNVFDFLRETVSKVPELGASEAASEDRSASAIKRRRVVGDEDHDSDGDLKKSRTIEAGHSTGSGRGRGRGRGRPRGRGARATERDVAVQNEKVEDDLDSPKPDVRSQDVERKDSSGVVDNESKDNAQVPVRNFDLNVGLDENGDLRDAVAAAPATSGADHDVKHEEFHGWSISDVEKMAFNPLQLASLNGAMEEEEDYDEEG